MPFSVGQKPWSCLLSRFNIKRLLSQTALARWLSLAYVVLLPIYKVLQHLEDCAARICL